MTDEQARALLTRAAQTLEKLLPGTDGYCPWCDCREHADDCALRTLERDIRTALQPPVDVRVENHGTLFLFRPDTLAAQAWILEHTDPDAPRWGTALAVEHRYARDLAQGMIDDGLRLA